MAIHDDIKPHMVAECTAVAVDALRRMADYVQAKHIRLVFEATNTRVSRPGPFDERADASRLGR